MGKVSARVIGGASYGSLFLGVDRYTALLLAVCSAYFTLVATQLNETNMGLTDEIALYTSWRLTAGVAPYRDMWVTQPPVIYVIGVLLLGINHSYLFVKIFDVLLSIAITILVYKLSLRLFNNKKIALASAVIYLALPIRYAIAPAFYPDNYSLFFMFASVFPLLNQTRRSTLLSSAFSALAYFTKYTALPIIVANVAYLVFKKKHLLKYYVIPFVALALSLTALLQVYSEGNYVSQTYPELAGRSNVRFLEGLWTIGKWEGLFGLLFAVGVYLYLGKPGRKSYVTMIVPSSFLPSLFMLLEGYDRSVFNFAEPWIALFAGYAVGRIYSSASTRVGHTKSFLKGGTLVLLVALSASTIYLYDLPGKEVPAGVQWKSRDQIISGYVEAVRKYSGTGDTILALPIIAFESERQIAFEVADYIFFQNSFRHGDMHAQYVMKSLMEKLAEKRIRVIVPEGHIFVSGRDDYSDVTLMQYAFPFNSPQVATLILNNYHPLNVEGVRIFVPNV